MPDIRNSRRRHRDRYRDAVSKKGWGILVAVVATAILIGMVIWAFAGAQDQPAATPAPTPTLSPTASESPPATPTASPTPTPLPTPATCETTSTAEFRAMVSQNGWISWETQDQTIGARPFDRFPEGAPVDQLICRWGESPDVPTDNLIDLAWSPIDPDAAAGAQQSLVAEGYERIDGAEGVYLAMRSADGWADAEGYGDSYLFTDDDVRWAMTKADLAYVKAPDEAE